MTARLPDAARRTLAAALWRRLQSAAADPASLARLRRSADWGDPPMAVGAGAGGWIIATRQRGDLHPPVLCPPFAGAGWGDLAAAMRGAGPSRAGRLALASVYVGSPTAADVIAAADPGRDILIGGPVGVVAVAWDRGYWTAAVCDRGGWVTGPLVSPPWPGSTLTALRVAAYDACAMAAGLPPLGVVWAEASAG